jgi:hypothetical protein
MSHPKSVNSRWRTRAGVLAVVGAALVGASRPATADDGPGLGEARSFAVLGGSTVESTGLTVVTGDVGVSPGTAITGFPPGTITRGSLHAGDASAAEAHADAGIAYAYLAGMASIPANNLSDIDLGGLTLTPAVYKFNAAAGLTGALTLDAQGNPNALFVIQVASSLTTASNASVIVINGGADYDESRVFWQVGSSATLGSGTSFTGNILAYASISLVTGTTMTGNALALTGAVTMDSNTITSPRDRRGNPNGRPTKGRTVLAPPVDAVNTDAVARLDVKHFPANRSRAERSWLRMKIRKLESNTTYTLWADDPSTLATDLVQFDSFTTMRSRNFKYMADTKKGGTLPFGATLANLSGMAIEVRDAAGTTTLLEGLIPSTTP